MIPYVLKLITPPLAEKETENVIARVMGGASEVSGHSQSRVTEKALPSAVLHEFALDFFSPTEAETFRKEIWSAILAGAWPAPRPFAISFLPKPVAERSKKLAVFDMDSTIIDQEVIDELARAFDLGDRVAEITEAAMQGRIDFQESLRERCQLLAGMPFTKAASIIPGLSVSAGGTELIRFLKSQSIHTAIVSGGFEFVLKHFQTLLGVDEIHAHRLIRDDGDVLTGKVEEPIIDAEGKRALVAEMKSRLGITREETITIGDGANDLLMMNEAGMSVSFCGKPKLAAVANTLILHRNLLWLKMLSSGES